MPATTSLKETAQTFRDKATKMLRLKAINECLYRIYNVNLAIEKTMKNLETLAKEMISAKKIVKRAEYKLGKLDSNDPDFAENKEKATKFVEVQTKVEATAIKGIEEDIKIDKTYIEDREKRITELDKEIVAIETGDVKMSKSAVNDLADSLIMKS